MPLSDWLGYSRQQGFAYHLQNIASHLGLQGEIVDGVGYYQVCGRIAMHPLIISLQDGVEVCVLSNVRFPPGRVPQQAALMLMEWSAGSRHYSWDVHNNPRWCCFFIRTYLSLDCFRAAFLKRAVDEAIVDVVALDDMLTGGSLHKSAIAIQALPHKLPVSFPAHSREIPDYVSQLARRLLQGP